MEKQNKIILSILLIGFLLLVTINLASAEFWICLEKNEMITYCNNYKPPYTCSINSGCQKCMSVYNATGNCYIHGVWGNCMAEEGQQCSSIGENGTQVDGTAPIITLYNPINNSVYGERAVLLNFVLNEESDVYYTDVIDGRGRWTRVCQECTSYSHSRSFDEGFNHIQFKMIDGADNENYTEVQFFIDSEKPRISKTEPRRGFANGDFYVQFSEENPETLVLGYGNLITGFRNANVDLDSCVIDRTKTNCDISVNLSDYDGEQIDYWFNITDIAGNSYQSRPNTVEIDKTPPVINSMNYTIDRTRVTFNFNVTEDNFDAIEYQDNSESRPRWRTMCSRLNNEVCTKRITLRSGVHDLSIQVADEAGNIISPDGGNVIITII